MQTEKLKAVVIDALDDLKAINVVALDVADITSVTDVMVIATGTSDRHTRSLANNVVDMARAAGVKPLGMEGQTQGDWVLIDLGDVVVHIMQQEARDFYNLEKLWSMSEPASTNVRAQ